MHTPNKQDIINDGWRLSANISDALVSRCAAEVLDAYILKRVSMQQVTQTPAESNIGRCWRALTMLACAQDDTFATSTGGEKKIFTYGNHADDLGKLKASVALLLQDLKSVETCHDEYDDVCNIFLRNQFFH
ncbi:MAG: hypothetical protein MJZ90_10250 [Bacteroidales bacterium]|nr:hypothetical protein [Bacteroidales bacterium]